MRRCLPILLLGLTLLTACGAEEPGGGLMPADETTSPDRQTSASPRPDAATARPSTTPPRPTPRRDRVRHLGIDASHHQGTIDWRAVANDGISFAYLKATEGTSFTDPTFAAHRAEALDLGLAVAGYHYFSLCTPGAAQADHFVSVLGDTDTGFLPPAVDVELLGSCATPPPRGQLLAEIRAFLERVEERTGRRPVVYLFPDFEEEYGAAADLAAYRHWVRDLDSRPDRDWWIWQRTDSGSVDGVDGPVDVNVLFRQEAVPR